MSIEHGSAEATASDAVEAPDERLEDAATDGEQPTETLSAEDLGEPTAGGDGTSVEGAGEQAAGLPAEEDETPNEAEPETQAEGASPPPPPNGDPGTGPAPNGGAAPAQLVPVSAEQIAFALGQAQARQKPKARKGPAFWVPVTILAVIAGLGLLAGAFFIGRSTRDSPDVVAGKVSAAVTVANKASLIRARNALDAQRKKLKADFRKTLKRQERLSYQKGRREGEAAGYASGQSAGYASGQASGYSAGKADGTAEGQAQGYQEGFDQGTCYTPGTLNYVC